MDENKASVRWRFESRVSYRSSRFQSSTSTQNRSFPQGETFHAGDFVYIEANDETSEPTIVCIESFENVNDEEYLNGLQFIRPIETYHLPSKKFLRQEVFLTQTLPRISMKKIQGLCHVLHVKDYFKYQPVIENTAMGSLQFQNPEKDIYVCESRYQLKTRLVKKIKLWSVPESKRIKLIPRESPLDNTRVPLPVNHPHQSAGHRSSTTDTEPISTDIIERIKESIPYDSVINDKLNENLAEKKQFYEQLAVSSNVSYKVGDYVYIAEKHQSDKRSILRIDQIWREKK